jgi:hypothetical protein
MAGTTAKPKPKTPKMTAAEAKALVIRQDKDYVLNKLAQGQYGEDKAREVLRKKRAAQTKAIATAVSAKPLASDWYAHPGAVSASEVRDKLGLSTMQLHRVMERYRKEDQMRKKASRR